jgi:shikimate kinase
MNNIILIGMPSCGKSTIGVVLAKALGYGFLDSDLLIQERENRLLCEIIEDEGIDRFNQIENEVNANINTTRTIIATGGSVIYGKEAMNHLKKLGKVVYIKLSYEQIQERLGNLESRGVSIRDGQSLEELYEERIPLYEKYADITVVTEGLSIKDTVALIKEKLIQEK